jgi:hypothetical protein
MYNIYRPRSVQALHSFTLLPLYHMERAPCTHRIGSRACPRAGLVAVQKSTDSTGTRTRTPRSSSYSMGVSVPAVGASVWLCSHNTGALPFLLPAQPQCHSLHYYQPSGEPCPLGQRSRPIKDPLPLETSCPPF